MPESKVRKTAAEKRKQAAKDERAAERAKQKTTVAPGSRQWVLPAFITLGLLGVLWLVVSQLAGQDIGFMRSLGNWNIGIAMALIVASMGLFTQWK